MEIYQYQIVNAKTGELWTARRKCKWKKPAHAKAAWNLRIAKRFDDQSEYIIKKIIKDEFIPFQEATMLLVESPNTEMAVVARNNLIELMINTFALKKDN